MNVYRPQTILLLIMLIATTAHASKNDDSKSAQAERDIISRLQPISLHVAPNKAHLKDRFDCCQLLVFGTTAKGETLDLTRVVEIKQTPDCVAVDENRLITAKANGKGKIVVGYKTLTAELPVSVVHFDKPIATSFKMHVQPVLSKLGCNAGTCHGSKDGKNGFKLSLRGYDPVYDYRSLTDDLSARRFNKASPDQSLFLLKASGAVPHAGGGIVDTKSAHYQILKNWISQGAKYDSGSVPRVASIEVVPKNPVVPLPDLRQQVRVIATYTDGRRQDVTREAFVESGNIDVARTEPGGRLKTLRRGEAAALVRYEGAYAATTVTVMGDRSGFVWKSPPTFNRIDELVYDKLKRVKVAPGKLCSDEEFIRRVYLDLTGLPPSVEVVRGFMTDRQPVQKKRDALVDQLIGSPEFVEFWTNKWADLLQVNRKFLGERGAVTLRNWIKHSVAINKPYDQFAREIIVASGSNLESPPASYYKILREPDAIMENTTHLFLAIRFNCNKCHDHPFERWTQDQYYNMTAFFAHVGLKRDPSIGQQKIGGSAVSGAKPLVEIIFDKANGEVKHERTGQVSPPVFPFTHGDMPASDLPRRKQLAHWLTSKQNPYFARSFVNRLWGYQFGIGIIDPIDDIRAGNPPTNPELLDYLAKEFIDHGFDMQHILSMICKSRVYQHSIVSNRWNEDDEINFSHFIPRRLPAETLYDTIHASLGVPLNIPGAAKGVRAAELPDAGIKVPFLDDFGRPARESACECERSSGVVLGPVMKLINGPTIANTLKNPQSELNQLIAKEKNDDRVIEELFLRMIARKPTRSEIEAAKMAIESVGEGHIELVAQLAAYEKALLAKLPAWEKKIGQPVVWQAIKPTRMESDAKAKFELGKDHSIFVTGPLAKDVYRIGVQSKLQNITGIRIEALADKRLKSGGPGRAENGNFVLSELQLFVVDPKEPQKRTPIKLGKPRADFSQSGWPVANAIDGNDGTGWAVMPQFNKNHFAIYETVGSMTSTPTQLEIVMRQQFPDGKHNLGRFRISLTDSKQPLTARKLPAPLATALAVEPKQRTAAQLTVIRDYFLSLDSGHRQLVATVELSKYEIANRRLVGIQDVAWALINSPAFLFNR